MIRNSSKCILLYKYIIISADPYICKLHKTSSRWHKHSKTYLRKLQENITFISDLVTSATIYMVLLFIVWSIEYCDTDKDKLESTEIKQLNDSSLAAPLPWSELNNTLQALLPCVDNVTYIIENYEEKPKYHFQGAPERKF